MSLPAPVCTPHELCKKAAKLMRKHAKHAKVDDASRHLLLHWDLRDHGLVVNSRDYLKLLLKGSYRLPSPPQAKDKAAAQQQQQQQQQHGQIVRFATRERSVFIQPRSAMTAVLQGELVDVVRAQLRRCCCFRFRCCCRFSASRFRLGFPSALMLTSCALSPLAWPTFAQHNVGDYAIELRPVDENHDGTSAAAHYDAPSSRRRFGRPSLSSRKYGSALDGGGAAADDGSTSSYQVKTLTLRFDLPELLTELAATVGTGTHGKASGDKTAGSSIGNAAQPAPISPLQKPESVCRAEQSNHRSIFAPLALSSVLWHVLTALTHLALTPAALSLALVLPRSRPASLSSCLALVLPRSLARAGAQFGHGGDLPHLRGI